MSQDPVDVGDWYGVRPLRGLPVLVAEVGAPPDAVLALLARALEGQRCEVVESGPTRLRARWRPRWWLATTVASLATLQLDTIDLARTEVVVEASAHGAGTTLRISVPTGTREPQGRARVLAALTATFQDLQRGGATVSVTPWVKLPRR